MVTCASPPPLRLFPKGAALRRAVRWLGRKRAETPSPDFPALIEQASIRFDLSPPEARLLLEHSTKPGAPNDPYRHTD